jgi:pyridoxine 4-dehydrogenase
MASRCRSGSWRTGRSARVALAWLLQRSPNLLLIPGTSSVTHLRENLAAAELELDAIDAIA